VSERSEKVHELKRKLSHELRAYFFNTGFLLVFLLSFTTYRRLVLAEYNIGAVEYSFAIIEALILGKVVLIGEALHVGSRFEDRPLFVSTLWKTLLFSILVVAFSTLEHVVRSYVHHKPLAEELSFAGAAGLEKLARIQLMLVCFLPFFAFQELGRVLGGPHLLDLFFRRRQVPPGAAGDGAA